MLLYDRPPLRGRLQTADLTEGVFPIHVPADGCACKPNMVYSVASDIKVRVRMINVNKGRSPELQAACRPLMEYAWIVDKVHEFEECRTGI